MIDDKEYEIARELQKWVNKEYPNEKIAVIFNHLLKDKCEKCLVNKAPSTIRDNCESLCSHFNRKDGQDVYFKLTSKQKPKLHIFSGEDARLRILTKAYKIAMENEMDWNHISVQSLTGDYENFFKILWENFELK